MADDEAAQVEQTIDEEEAAREERNQIWQCFMQFDHEQQGTMYTQDLKQALEHLGERVSDTAVFRMISDMDPNNTGQLSFYQFKEIV